MQLSEFRGVDIDRTLGISKATRMNLEARQVIRPRRTATGLRRYSQADAEAIARYIEERRRGLDLAR